MSAKSYPSTSGGSGGQHGAPNRSQKSPERPRGKSKRTLIESACTACQKRKSRCDGQRPACSRCQALHTDCRYHAEEGESRWSALRRRNQTLERERDEARDLLAQMQTRPEPEANQIYQRIRTDTNASDLGTLIHDVASALSPNTSQQNQQQHEHSLAQQQQDELRRRSLQHQPHFYPQQPQQQQQQQHDQVSPTQQQTPFTQPNYTGTAPGPQLPPLRSVVGVPLLPPVGPSVAQRPLPQPSPPSTQQRHMSMGSGVSNGSYSSLSSSDGRAEHSLSPRDDQAPTWAHGYNQ